MKTVGIMLCALGLCVEACRAADAAATSPDAKDKIGVYDSRAVALAFIDSPAFKVSVGQKLAENTLALDKAKAEHNLKRTVELSDWIDAYKSTNRKQTLSTEPVDEILAHIQAQIPAITKAAGVESLVSKWNKRVLAKYTQGQLVDVTMLLVRAFQPTETQLKAAIEIQKEHPIPLKQVR